MRIIPNLNLNKHPINVEDGHLVSAHNMMISKDTGVLQTEDGVTKSLISNNLDIFIYNNYASSNYKIIYAIPCNKEIVFFVNVDNNNNLKVIRYFEKYDFIKYICDFEYHNGKLIGTFTYNMNNLIIAISEYGDNISIPLRTINLGSYEKGVENDEALQMTIDCQSIVPSVKIPSVICNRENGITYKGWYYVFIRYKVSRNTYTQWYNTNANIFIDSFSKNNIEDYYISKDVITDSDEFTIENILRNFGGVKSYDGYHTFIKANVSDNKDVCNVSFNCEVLHKDNKYSQYQLGFVCITKTYTKGFRSFDININNTTRFVFNRNNVVEHAVSDIITSYNNYYNCKALTFNQNRLYIANYKENDYVNDIIGLCKNINVNIKFKVENVDIKEFELANNGSAVIEVNNSSITNTIGIQLNQPYNLFVHFVDKYGAVSRGINLSYFNTNYSSNDEDVIIKELYNQLSNKILMPFTDKYIANNKKLIAEISIDFSKVKDYYIGAFLSYEQIEKYTKHRGFVYNIKNTDNKYIYNNTYINNNVLSFYSDILNTDDAIDFKFDKAILYELNTKFITAKKNISHTCNITNKILKVADSFNNVLKSTHIDLEVNQEINGIYYCELVDTKSVFYNNEQKTLIPCTNIIYDNVDVETININNSFNSRNNALIFLESFFNDATKTFQKQSSTKAATIPFIQLSCYMYSDIPVETLQFNNKPEIIFFPIEGINTTDVNRKSFRVGCVTKCKNTIDLYQQKNVTVYSNYPKTLDWYNNNVHYITNFPKIIRKSAPMQDESYENNWRKFAVEDYKNINENKGDIIKLVSSGTVFLVHTQHSLFAFSGDNTLNNGENNQIKLADIDFWNTSYKEIIPSELGYCGIQDEQCGIIGNFGYIWFDSDNNQIFKYYNNNVVPMDTNIVNWLKANNFNTCNIFNDIDRYRLLFNFDNKTVISYNYNTNTFVSFHDYQYNKIYGTKTKHYIVNTDRNKIYNFNTKLFINELYDNISYRNKVDILIKQDYNTIKTINSLIYKITAIDTNTDNSTLPVEGGMPYYACDYITIYNRDCNTGKLNISVDNTGNDINKVDNYYKPYKRFGNWHFNTIRNNLSEYYNNNIIADEASRMYGNYFIVEFVIDNKLNNINSTTYVDFENIELITNNAELY